MLKVKIIPLMDWTLISDTVEPRLMVTLCPGENPVNAATPITTNAVIPDHNKCALRN